MNKIKNLALIMLVMTAFSCDNDDSVDTIVYVSPLEMSFDRNSTSETIDYDDWVQDGYTQIRQKRNYTIDDVNLSVNQNFELNFQYEMTNSNLDYNIFSVTINEQADESMYNTYTLNGLNLFSEANSNGLVDNLSLSNTGNNLSFSFNSQGEYNVLLAVQSENEYNDGDTYQRYIDRSYVLIKFTVN